MSAVMTEARYRGSELQYEAVVHERVMVPMRDGTRLASDVYLPALNGKAVAGRFPAILEHTPYGRSAQRSVTTGRYFARRGYACIFQDVRGRGDSEGEWLHFFNPNDEVTDGFDAAAWLTEQEWSSGQFGTIGVSYTGALEQALAISNPPGLKAQFLIDCGYNYHTHGQRSHGAMFLSLYMPFFFRMAREDPSIRHDLEAQRALEDALATMPAWLQRTPLLKGQSPLARVPKYEQLFLEIAQHGDYDSFWKGAAASLEEHLGRYPDVPLYLLTSWYGYHVWANGMKFNALRSRLRSPVHLTIGTWLHGFDTLEQWWSGDADFGIEAAFSNVDDIRLQFFDHHLKGLPTASRDEAPVRFFVMGGGEGARNAAGRLEHGGRWVQSEQWPPAGVQPTKYFLHGDGSLGRHAPAATVAARSFVFDPSNPMPSIGGAGSGGGFDQRANPRLNFMCKDDGPLAERSDVLVYQTEPLGRSVTVAGPVEVLLWASSSARDTDFTAKLIDVYPASADYPQGYALNLCDGIVRARYRARRDKAELLEPGRVYEFTLQIQGTANVFAPGHRIRVDISSSNFPLYDVNPNTGAPLWSSAEKQRAMQAVFCDAEHPSHLVLPVVED